MTLTKAQANLLLNIGETKFAGTDAELREHIINTYYVIDDSPFPYPVRAKQMKTLEVLASKMGFTIA